MGNATRRRWSHILRGSLLAIAAAIVGTMPVAAEVQVHIQGPRSPLDPHAHTASQITTSPLEPVQATGEPPAIPTDSPTGHQVSYRFARFYDGSGGLPVFGYPISPPVLEQGRLTQYFERQRFEHHPEHKGTPYEVLLGRLGVVAAERAGLTGHPAFQPRPAATNDASCDYLAETGHRICLGFRAYWKAHGLEFGDPGVSFRESLALFGYPISEEFTDPATGLTVQYFERARFEHHPKNPEPNKVLLGLLAGPLWAEAAPSAEPAPDALVDPLGQEIAAFALRHLGAPYAWGGTTPAGFDCSGFIFYVVNRVLGNYPRMLDQMLLRGTPVNRHDLQPGDIVFQENTYTWGISHGGIYLGNGQFIHAESERTGVIISDLWSDYWSAHYLTARRLSR